MSRPTDWQDIFGINDPTPGDPDVLQHIAHRWATVADAAEFAETKLRGLLGDQVVATWIGQAGDAFRTHTTDLPGQLKKTKDSYRLAAGAMNTWARQVHSHQETADRALVQGRIAHDDLRAARARVSTAQADVYWASMDSSLAFSGPATSAYAPTADQISAATGRLQAAQSASHTAQALVDDAQSRLDAARALALDASSLREQDGRATATTIRAAADAGIKPRSFWDRLGDAISDAWHVVVAVAKVAVAVLGVIALIVGGPLAWVVVIAAAVVLADTAIKYAEGKAGLWDVAMAALCCIPCTKGLTTLAALKGAFEAGGILGTGAHLLGAVQTAGVNLVRIAQRFRQGAIPAISTLFTIGTANFVMADVRQAAGIQKLAALTRGLNDIRKEAIDAAWASHIDRVGRTDPARAARLWQGHAEYMGVDGWRNEVLPRGTVLEALTPGHTSGFVTPDGTIAGVGGNAGRYADGVQVAPSGNPRYTSPLRDHAIRLELSSDVRVATSVAHANPQYGSGGLTQHYIPNVTDRLADGSITAVDSTGQVLPVHVHADGSVSIRPADGRPIALNNPHPSSGVTTGEAFTHRAWHEHRTVWAATPLRLDDEPRQQ